MDIRKTIYSIKSETYNQRRHGNRTNRGLLVLLSMLVMMICGFYMDNQINFDNPVDMPKIARKADAASIPAKYSLVKKKKTTSIKDQGITGCCWAFATIKSIESNAIKRGIVSANNADFSESHLTWFSYHATADTSSIIYGDGIYDEVVMTGNNGPLPNWKFATKAGAGNESGLSLVNESIKNGKTVDVDDKVFAKSKASLTQKEFSEKDITNAVNLKRLTAITGAKREEAEDASEQEITESPNPSETSPAQTAPSDVEPTSEVTPTVEPTSEATPTLTPTVEPTSQPPTQTPDVSTQSAVTPTATPVILQTKSTTSAYSNGGSALLSVFTLASWMGVADESKYPFNANDNAQLSQTAKVIRSAGEAARFDSEVHLRDASCYDYASRNSFKKAIMKNGAADIAIYYDESFMQKRGGYYNYNQIYYTGAKAYQYANHCVTIVGWNDNYSKNKFLCKPEKNGAWLVANSYGTTANNNGYFWLSYYDASITDCYSYACDSASKYSTVYQYDGCGYGDYLALHNKNIPVGNIFKTPDNTAQTLKSVGFYTITDRQKYIVKVYRHVNGQRPTNGTPVKECTVKGKFMRSGYHTVDLPAEVELEAGESFSIVVTYKKTRKYKNNYAPFEGEGFDTQSMTFKYSAKSDQSYFYYRGVWYDSYKEGFNNAPIKGYVE